MVFLFLPLAAVFCFGAIVLAFKFFNKDCIYVFAIGAVIGANIYNIGGYALISSNIIFGIDSVLYTLFVFCALLMHLLFGKKEAIKLMWTSVGSIMFTASIDFIANWSINGFGYDVMWGFVSYVFSAIATIMAILIMVKLTQKMLAKKRNIYLIILVTLAVANVIDSLVYFGLVAVATFTIQSNLVPMLAGSYIGKFMSVAFSMLAYYFINKIQNKNLKQIETKQIETIDK